MMSRLETRDLVLSAYLQLRGHRVSVRKEREVGYFSFDESAKGDIEAFYSGDNEFKVFHNNIRDLKQHLKSL